MANISTDELDLYVSFVDNEAKGDLRSPKVAAKFFPLDLTYRTYIDETLSPFSDEYYRSQIRLYEEISARKLDQCAGELHEVNDQYIQSLLSCPNPLGINDVDHISENVRALTSMLSISCLGTDAEVLDLGAGHGLSSEAYAFCGCKVHSIDIDPELSRMALMRAEARSLRISRSVMNFDSLNQLENNFYDAAFFFQSLHHCLRPWDLISELKLKLTDSGVIGFCGEPIQDKWWKHWGVRLDPESLYVARKYGWFESGWSSAFIVECFRRNGLKLALIQGGHLGGLIGITSKNEKTLAKILAKSWALGMQPIGDMGIEIRKYRSQIGELLESSSLRPTIRALSGHGGGFLCYGPYISLEPGRYRVSFILSFIKSSSENDRPPLAANFDIVSSRGKFTHCKLEVGLTSNERSRFVNADFNLVEEAQLVEARLHISNSNEIWEVSIPIFQRI